MTIAGRVGPYMIRKYGESLSRPYPYGIYRVGGAFVTYSPSLSQAYWLARQLCVSNPDEVVTRRIEAVVEDSR